jgi:hypothetical protein
MGRLRRATRAPSSALERGNLLVAELTTKEIGRVSLSSRHCPGARLTSEVRPE